MKWNSLLTKRQFVHVLLHIMDPEGIELRRKRRLKWRIYSIKGPNSVWHIYGYDKRSRYGITIHGCIDGFSCQIIWLKASVSNKNPNIIAHHYIESIKKIRSVSKTFKSWYEYREHLCWSNSKVPQTTPSRRACRRTKLLVRKKHKQPKNRKWSAVREFNSGWMFFKDLQKVVFITQITKIKK